MYIKSMIISQIEQIAMEQDQRLTPLTDDLLLAESGLDSLALAILVARLEDSLGVDPFSASDKVFYPTTLGDLVRAYESALT